MKQKLNTFNLLPSTWTFTDRETSTNQIDEITHKLHLKMVDQKVINALTDTKSSMHCYVCGATPKQFNNLSNFPHPKNNTYKYGISPLHKWIRCFEMLIHISYRIEVQKWWISAEDQAKVSATCDESLEHLQPKQKSYNWNDLKINCDLETHDTRCTDGVLHLPGCMCVLGCSNRLFCHHGDLANKQRCTELNYIWKGTSTWRRETWLMEGSVGNVKSNNLKHAVGQYPQMAPLPNYAGANDRDKHKPDSWNNAQTSHHKGWSESFQCIDWYQIIPELLRLRCNTQTIQQSVQLPTPQEWYLQVWHFTNPQLDLLVWDAHTHFIQNRSTKVVNFSRRSSQSFCHLRRKIFSRNVSKFNAYCANTNGCS